MLCRDSADEGVYIYDHSPFIDSSSVGYDGLLRDVSGLMFSSSLYSAI